MTNFIRALLLGALCVLSGPTLAADLGGKKSAADPLDIPALAPALNWTGLYIGLGVGANLQTAHEADFDEVSISNENWTISGRLGYRYQPRGSIFVIGVGADAMYSPSGKLAQGAELSLAVDGFGEIGIATGGIILTVQGGYSTQPVDIKGGFGDIDLDGPFAGVELGADLGNNWTLVLNPRAYFANDKIEGFKLESERYEIMGGLQKRF